MLSLLAKNRVNLIMHSFDMLTQGPHQLKNLTYSCFFLLWLTLFFVSTNSTRADDPEFITFSGGLFDFNRQKDEGAEFRVEYRSNEKLWLFKPFAVASIVNNGMSFWGGGVLLDIYFGRRLVFTPSFAPTLWFGETDDLDLGHVIEFRSQIEIAYRFDNRSRLGVSVSHYSNASLADENPGTESLLLNYSMPFKNLANLF